VQKYLAKGACMDNYYFLYKDSQGQWQVATSPIFIAKHQYCRAIPKSVVKEAGLEFIGDFTYQLNNTDTMPVDIDNLINTYELY
jgi:hypothetical protein